MRAKYISVQMFKEYVVYMHNCNIALAVWSFSGAAPNHARG